MSEEKWQNQEEEVNKMAVDLSKIKKKYEEVKQKTTSSTDNIMDFEIGDNLVRVLSPEDGSDFYKEVGYHYIKIGEEKKAVVCLRLTLGQPCYLCEVVSELYKSKDKGDKTLAKQLRGNMRVFYNVIHRKDNTLKVMATGNQVFKQILGFMADEDWGDLTHAETGRDIVITKQKTGEGLTDVEYVVKPKPKQTELGFEMSEIELFNLDEIVGEIPTYDEQKAIFEGEEVPEKPVDKPKQSSGKPLTLMKPVVEKPSAPSKPTASSAPVRRAKAESTVVEKFADKIAMLDLSFPKAQKAYENWKSADGTEETLDKLLEMYGKEDIDTGSTEGAPETASSGDELDDQIQAALKKFKKK